jgi:hypothetical protein
MLLQFFPSFRITPASLRISLDGGSYKGVLDLCKLLKPPEIAGNTSQAIKSPKSPLTSLDDKKKITTSLRA